MCAFCLDTPAGVSIIRLNETHVDAMHVAVDHLWTGDMSRFVPNSSARVSCRSYNTAMSNEKLPGI